jgi:hypothetical protein
MGYIYLDATPIGDGLPYHFTWDRMDLGSADAREPQMTSTAGGNFEVFPIATAYGARKGTLAIHALCADQLNKRRLESVIKGLLNGSRTLHFAGKQLPIYLFGAKEVADDSRKAATIIGVEASFVAGQPLWSYNQPLKGLLVPVNAGQEWKLWDDGSLPAIIPAYGFTTAALTFSNWGTAFTWAAGTIVSGPVEDGVNPTVYLHNTTAGAPTARLPIVLDAGGNGSFLASSEFFIGVGANTLVVENLAGAAIAPGGSYKISFGDTYMRYL